MKNLLRSLSNSSVEPLLGTAQSRRLQASLRVRIPAAVTCLLLCVGVGAATYALCLPLVEPIASLGDASLLRQTSLVLTLFGTMGFSAMFHCTVPLLIQHPPKRIAALPITKYQWIWPQVRSLYVIAILTGHGILVGLAAAIAHIDHNSSSWLPATILSICSLWLCLGIGYAFNGVAQRKRRWAAVANGAYAAQLCILLFAMRSSAGIELIKSLSSAPLGLPKLALLFTVSLASTLYLFRFSRVAARTVLAVPVRYVLPRSGRHANPATTRGLVHSLIIATFRGLRYDLQAGFFALSMIVIGSASVAVAARLNNQFFTSAVITNNATMLPLGLASWFAFARQKVGKQRSSIYKKPQSSATLLALQALPICSVALVVATASTLAACRVLGTTPLVDEIIRLGGLAFVLALAGYGCGVVAYPVKGEHTSVVAAVLLTFVCAGLILSADQPLRTKPLAVHFPVMLFISVVIFLGCLGVERFSQKGLRT